MDRRSITGLLLAGITIWLLLAALPASGAEGIRDRKADVDAKIETLQSKIERAREREGVLSAQIEVVSDKIAALEDEVGAASARLDQLESVLALHRRKLARLNELFRLQTRKLVFLQQQHRAATERLNRRIVEIYTSEPTEALTVVLEAATFSDLMDQLDYLSDIGRQDENIAAEVKHAKLEMRDTRNATRRTRNAVAETTRTVAARTAEQRAVRDRLAWSQRELATARRDKRAVLSNVREDKEHAIEHMRELELQSAALAAKIQSAQAAAPVRAPTSAPSSSGFIWPVHGILTSGYGWRWGRLHAGIDIAVGSGTPVVASASGTVIVAGWMGGYGNLVVIDHGNGIATAYGHNSSIAAGAGQYVAQGQLIAYSGNTGHSTGPHVHFEVRVGGVPVDPLGYL
jgi:murein DD-endopeptidase MepM/ murein hydrolase activator NlpD